MEQGGTRKSQSSKHGARKDSRAINEYTANKLKQDIPLMIFRVAEDKEASK